MNTKIKVALASIPLLASGLFVATAHADNPPLGCGECDNPVVSRTQDVEHRHGKYRLCYDTLVLNYAGTPFHIRVCDTRWHRFRPGPR